MKQILFILLVFMSLIIHSQGKFELTPDGFVNGDKSYIVLEYPNQKSDVLYNKVKSYLSSIYKNPSKVLNEVDNKMINISGYAGNQIRRNSMHVFNMDYNIIIHFKDGKIKIDAPSFSLTKFTTKHQTLHLKWTKFSIGGSNLGIFGKKGKLKSKKAKKDLEAFFNTYVQNLKTSLESKQDDW